MTTHASARRRDDRGFSLVEILIVIVVLGVLATVSVFAVRGITDRGEQASCDEDRRIMLTAVESYFAQEGGAAIATSNPAVPGVTGLTPEDTLVAAGFLATISELHDVDGSGSVTAAASAGC